MSFRLARLKTLHEQQLITEEEYAEQVENTALFLRGKSQELMVRLADDMEQAAAELEYEKACRGPLKPVPDAYRL